MIRSHQRRELCGASKPREWSLTGVECRRPGRRPCVKIEPVVLLCDYFSAVDDGQAAETIDWVGGPSQPPEGSEKKSDPRLTVQMPGIEPAVMLRSLESIMTGQPYDQLPLLENPVAIGDGGERLVLRVSHGLLDAVSQADDRRLREVAQSWSQIPEFWGQGDPEVLARCLSELAGLVRQSRERGEQVYCWMRV